jgi:hypothetical protein
MEKMPEVLAFLRGVALPATLSDLQEWTWVTKKGGWYARAITKILKMRTTTVIAVRMRSLNSISQTWLFMIGKKHSYSQPCTASSVQRPREGQTLISTMRKSLHWSDDASETRPRKRRRAAPRSARTHHESQYL